MRFAGVGFTAVLSGVLLYTFVLAFMNGLVYGVWETTVQINVFGEAWWELVLILCIAPFLFVPFFQECRKYFGKKVIY